MGYDWTPGLHFQDTRLLGDVYDTLGGLGQMEVPFIVRLFENPKSAIALPGAINLFNHDCLHILLGRGLWNQDEAFIIGFSMGNDVAAKSWHRSMFKLISSKFYGRDERFIVTDLIAYDIGYEYGKECVMKNIHNTNFGLYMHKEISETRCLLGISEERLLELRNRERLSILSPSSDRLNSFV